MRVQMPWFPPLGVLSGLGGTQMARHFFHVGGRRQWLEAGFALVLGWFPLLVWLLIQFLFLEK